MTDAALWLWVGVVAVGAVVAVDDVRPLAELVELDDDPPHPANPLERTPRTSAATATFRRPKRRCLLSSPTMIAFYVRRGDVSSHPPDVSE